MSKVRNFVVPSRKQTIPVFGVHGIQQVVKEVKVLELFNKFPEIYGSNHTFSRILRIGSTTLLGSTVPQVTLGSKGVNAK